MKKNLLVTLCLLLMAGAGFSQQHTYIKAGLGATSILDLTNVPYPSSYSPRLSYMLGIGRSIPVSSQIDLRGELVYLNKGYTFSHNSAASIHFQSIGLSILGAVQLLNFLEIEAGLMPNRAFAIHNQEGYSLPLDIFGFRKGDLAAQLGASVRLSKVISLTPTLLYGLFPIEPGRFTLTDEDNNTLIDKKLRQHHIQAMLSVRYRL